MGYQLLLQRTACLHIKATIDGLVRHAVGLSVRVFPLQPPCDLLRRPVFLQFRSNSLPQASMNRQLKHLWALGLFPCTLIGDRRTIAARPAVATNLPADG